MKFLEFFWNKIIARGCAYLTSLIAVHWVPQLIGVKKWWHLFSFQKEALIEVDEKQYYIIVFILTTVIGFLIYELVQYALNTTQKGIKWLMKEKPA